MNSNPRSLSSLVKEYKGGKAQGCSSSVHCCSNYEELEKELKEFREYSSLKDLIENIENCGKKKNGEKKFNLFETLFDFLLPLKEKIKGIGELTHYDFALRIGAYLGHFPQKIYLHSGTKEGAESLLKKKISEDSLETKDFPKELQCLKPYHIENFLCIYKKKLKGLS